MDPNLNPSEAKSGVKPPHSKNRLVRYGPVVLWAALIFIFSSGLFSGSNTSTLVRPLVQWVYPSISEGGLALVHGLIRKASHFVEYAILALLVARALRTSSREFLRNHWFAVSLTFVAVYALSDEFHQSFVSSRTASIYDCLIDTAGGLAALLFVRARIRVQSPRVSKVRCAPSPSGRGSGVGVRSLATKASLRLISFREAKPHEKREDDNVSAPR